MTNDQVLECYTFVHLCNTTAYGTDVKDQLDGRLGGLQNLLSALELPDETWELVVRRNYVTELIRELTSKFPDCVCLEYDPTKPSAAEIEQFGRYDIAKKWKEFTFLDRAQYMKEDAWDTAAKYYSLRAEDNYFTSIRLLSFTESAPGDGLTNISQANPHCIPLNLDADSDNPSTNWRKGPPRG
jgi:hypothetical protein